MYSKLLLLFNVSAVHGVYQKLYYFIKKKKTTINNVHYSSLRWVKQRIVMEEKESERMPCIPETAAVYRL